MTHSQSASVCTGTLACSLPAAALLSARTCLSQVLEALLPGLMANSSLKTLDLEKKVRGSCSKHSPHSTCCCRRMLMREEPCCCCSSALAMQGCNSRSITLHYCAVPAAGFLKKDRSLLLKDAQQLHVLLHQHIVIPPAPLSMHLHHTCSRSAPGGHRS
jgi:hypothetical protein